MILHSDHWSVRPCRFRTADLAWAPRWRWRTSQRARRKASGGQRTSGTLRPDPRAV